MAAKNSKYESKINNLIFKGTLYNKGDVLDLSDKDAKGLLENNFICVPGKEEIPWEDYDQEDDNPEEPEDEE
ncbi:hypothetical protein J2Z76_002722 [Sedimentibacter acidaminivorans]|uniref:Uncharacterized protein n=1 Tax=Sedimentibacter acidaminivorans TaxID=913099 RepID=A0ABS4GGV3_9FIRM|nr:hypothetical protein [Sedimentibacter acidaminivorans]MBP1926852.1 hypothetical protein [Sedimentibacter acidaminivorans]